MSEKCDCTDKCARSGRVKTADGGLIAWFTPYVPECVQPNAPECKCIDNDFRFPNDPRKVQNDHS
jgi:hypothetical protein